MNFPSDRYAVGPDPGGQLLITRAGSTVVSTDAMLASADRLRSLECTLHEFVRYAAVAWTTQAINYGTFASILIVQPAVPPLAALLLASIVATIFAYVGMRYGAFRGRQ